MRDCGVNSDCFPSISATTSNRASALLFAGELDVGRVLGLGRRAQYDRGEETFFNGTTELSFTSMESSRSGCCLSISPCRA